MICVTRKELNCTVHIEVQTIDLALKHPFVKSKQVQFVLVALQPLQLPPEADKKIQYCFFKRSKITRRGFTVHWTVNLNHCLEGYSWQEKKMTGLDFATKEEELPLIFKSRTYYSIRRGCEHIRYI